MQLAVTSKQRVEISNARTESSAVFANPDGTVSVQSFTGPRWVKRSRTGRQGLESYFVDVDTTLVKQADGTYAPKAVSSGLVVTGGGSATIASITRAVDDAAPAGKETLRSVTVQFASGVLPTPTVTGSTATYPEVSPGVDLVVTATGTGFETSWVLEKRPTGPVDLGLVTSADGLTVETGPGGSVSFTDVKGTVVAGQSAAVMFDASRDAAGLPKPAVDVPGRAVAEQVRTSTAPGAKTSPGARASFTPAAAFPERPGDGVPGDGGPGHVVAGVGGHVRGVELLDVAVFGDPVEDRPERDGEPSGV
jgi:hypothetical protein